MLSNKLFYCRPVLSPSIKSTTILFLKFRVLSVSFPRILFFQTQRILVLCYSWTSIDNEDIFFLSERWWKTHKSLIWVIKTRWRSWKYMFVNLLYFDLRPGQKCHSRWCTARKWHILMAVRRGNRVGGNWLMKWDEVKKNSHGTLIDWCTGRERPVNCMTVISALMTIKHAISKIE